MCLPAGTEFDMPGELVEVLNEKKVHTDARRRQRKRCIGAKCSCLTAGEAAARSCQMHMETHRRNGLIWSCRSETVPLGQI